MHFSPSVKHLLVSSALAVTMTLAPSIGAANDVFLNVSGVPGEATDDGFQNQIAINTFSLGVVAGDPRVNTLGTVKPQFDTFVVTKRVDRSSPRLFQIAATQQHIATVVLSARKGVSRSAYYKITLSDASVSSYKVTEGTEITESVAFSFGKLEMEYFVQDAKGLLQPAGKVSFDSAAAA